MKKTKIIFAIAYMALSLVVSTTLAVSLFFECSEATQMALLIQGVGYAFCSGLYFNL